MGQRPTDQRLRVACAHTRSMSSRSVIITLAAFSFNVLDDAMRETLSMKGGVGKTTIEFRGLGRIDDIVALGPGQ